MTENVRQYPNISFVDTDTEALTNSLIRAFERFAGRTLYPADPVRLFILWIADIIIQERVNIDFSAKQNLPRYAEGEYLDSLAELFKDVYRLEPEAARTTIRFTLSIERDTATDQRRRTLCVILIPPQRSGGRKCFHTLTNTGVKGRVAFPIRAARAFCDVLRFFVIGENINKFCDLSRNKAVPDLPGGLAYRRNFPGQSPRCWRAESCRGKKP